MADIIPFMPKTSSKVRTSAELREIGLRIIASADFQPHLIDGKDDTDIPYDPVAVAIMHGHYESE